MSRNSAPSPAAPAAGQRLAARLAGLRRAAGMSLSRLAAATGLTKSYLSKLERGRCTPSISSASRLAAAFGIGIGELLGDTVSNHDLRITRAGGGRPVSADPGETAAAFLTGSPERSRTGLSAFISTPPLAEAERPPPTATHTGDEFLYLLAGRVELAMADRVERLEAGDAAWYRAEIPHRIRSLGETPAQVLILTCNCRAR